MKTNLQEIANRLVTGPGKSVDPAKGKADTIPATIDGVAPARLSEGEFVVPADVVASLGKGNPDAGSQILQSMIDQIRSLGSDTENESSKGSLSSAVPVTQ